MLGIDQFQYALKEAQITEAEELILTREDFYQELKALWKEHSLQIVPLAELSRNRWELLRASFTYCSKPLFPCYRTISRHWNNQPFIYLPCSLIMNSIRCWKMAPGFCYLS